MASANGDRWPGVGNGSFDRGRVGPDQFRNIFARHAAGVSIITFCQGDQPRGFTASSVVSVAADPPLVAFSISRSSSAALALAESPTVVINFLCGEHEQLARRFATSGIDRFGVGGWEKLPTGEPVITVPAAWMRCLIRERIDLGPSRLVVVEACEASLGAPSRSGLVYRNRAYHVVGTSCGRRVSPEGPVADRSSRTR